MTGSDGLSYRLRRERNRTVALDLAAAGWAVFALSGGKVPFAGTHGHLDASTDPADVARMMGRPDAVPGIALDDPYVVLDFDPRNDGHPSALGLEPASADVKTPGGGWHHYFKADGLRVRNGLLPGVDLKAEGGYVVAPGAVLPDGRSYAGSVPSPVPPMPEAVRALVDAALEARKGTVAADGPAARLGTRDELLSWAGALRNAACDEAEIRSLLLGRLADGRVESLDPARPWAEADLAKIAREMGRKPPGEWSRFTLVLQPVRVVRP